MEHEDFVTFEQAKSLKDLGFDWECNHYYQDNDQSLHINFYENFNKHSKINIEDEVLTKVILCSAPTLSQVQKWLFERHGYFLSIQYNSETENFQCVLYKQTFTQGYYCTNESYTKQIFQGSENLKSYEPTRCLAKGISKVLEILKDNKS